MSDEYSHALIKNLLEKTADTVGLTVFRSKEQTLFCTNNCKNALWIGRLGVPAIPMVYRQAFALSIAQGEFGQWTPVEDDKGRVVSVEFEKNADSSMMDLWKTLNKAKRIKAEISKTMYGEFHSKEILRLVQDVESTDWDGSGYVYEKALRLWHEAASEVARVEIGIIAAKENHYVGIYAGDMLVAALQAMIIQEK